MFDLRRTLSMTNTNERPARIYLTSAERVLRRSGNAYGLTAAEVAARLQKTTEKYLLAYAPESSDEEIRNFLELLNEADLCLVLACEKGSETAWEHFVAQFTPSVRQTARKIAPSAEAAEDLASTIWAELYGLRIKDDGSRSSKLLYYSGRGSLGGWLRAVVSQTAIDIYRRESRFVQIEEERELDTAAEHADDQKSANLFQTAPSPEDELSDKKTLRDIADALKTSVDALKSEDKLLVKLYYFDNLNLKQAGAALGFHEATASRRVARIHKDLRAAVEKNLLSKGWTQGDLATALNAAAEKLNTNLEKLFTAENAFLLMILTEFLRLSA